MIILNIIVVFLKVIGTSKTILLDLKLVRKQISKYQNAFYNKKTETNCNIKWSIIYDILELKSLQKN